ncbi:hypothetical protein CPCC7001_541 [Cyanobium sp. PCC 7001]|nr:hypothetical protein CPCC7001_541 [Cyanobium sp. PCC 7001]
MPVVLILLVVASCWVAMRVLLLSSQITAQRPEALLARQFRAELRQRGLLGQRFHGPSGE